MEQRYSHRCGGGVFAFVVGGLVGAGASLLLAPQSGKETRKQIRGLADTVIDTTEGYYEQIKNTVVAALEDGQELLGEKKERIMNAVKAGMETYEKKRKHDNSDEAGSAEPSPYE
jgi:gas vesicle protein